MIHWVSMFVDIENKFIFYFDSAGRNPDQMMNLVKKYKSRKTMNLKLHLNFIKLPLEHQYENTECGMYYYFSILLC